MTDESTPFITVEGWGQIDTSREPPSDEWQHVEMACADVDEEQRPSIWQRILAFFGV